MCGHGDAETQEVVVAYVFEKDWVLAEVRPGL